MAVKQAKTTSAAKRSGSAQTTRKKRTKKQSSKKRSSPGLMTKATEVVHAVIAAASGAVQGAVEAGKGNLRSDLNRALLKSFNANGIAIPFPQREIRIVGTDSNPDAAPPRQTPPGR